MPDLKLARQGGAVRLTLSARAANDLDALQKSLKSLAERLGHPACATGCDSLFMQVEREFVLTEELQLHAAPQSQQVLHGVTRAAPQDPIPTGPVHVLISDRINNNIKSLQRAVGATLGKLGCPACCSGFDILFQRELDLIAIDDRFGAKGFGRFR
jgi:hypothetical protein